jgi:hypothetical protein
MIRLLRQAMLLVAAIATACGGDSTAPSSDRPGPPSSLAIVSGNQQGQEAGTRLPLPLVVKLSDAQGRGLSRVSVSWSVTSGGGSVDPATSVTDGEGRTSTLWVLGHSFGSQSATARVGSLSADFTATATIDGHAISIVSGNNQAHAPGTLLPLPLVVKVSDGTGRGLSGVSVSWAVTGGGGTVDPRTSVTDSAGLASAMWVLGPTPGSQSVTASVQQLNVDFTGTGTSIVSGRVLATDDHSLAGLLFIVRKPGTLGGDSVRIDDNGSFSLPTRFGPSDTVEVIIDAIDQQARHFLPALFLTSGSELRKGMTIILIPRQWTIQHGTFAGRTVSISMDAALTVPDSIDSPFYLAQFIPGKDGDSWYPLFPQFSTDVLPVRVVFARPRFKSNEILTPDDSVAIWNDLRAIEQDVGLALFRPARYEDLTFAGSNWWSEEPAIFLTLDTTLGVAAVAFSGIGKPDQMWEWTYNVVGWSSGRTRDVFAVGRASRVGAAIFRSKLDMTHHAVLKHEMMHTLGFGHGCSWRSVMTYSYCQQLASDSPTEFDVAYVQLLRAVREEELSANTYYSILPALHGERSLMLGKPAVPSLGEGFPVAVLAEREGLELRSDLTRPSYMQLTRHVRCRAGRVQSCRPRAIQTWINNAIREQLGGT